MVAGLAGDQRNRKSRIVGVEQRIELFLGTGRVVAQAGDLVTHFAPGALQFVAVRGKYRLRIAPDAHGVGGVGGTDGMATGAEAGIAQCLHHDSAIRKANLQHGAEFLVEQRRDDAVAQAPGDLRKALAAVDIVHQWVVAEPVEIQRNADTRGEAHFADGGEQPAVGTVVIGEDLAVAAQCLDCAEEVFQQHGIGIRHGIAQLT